jgi:20S proteasome alpha/beta subunit
MTIAIGLISRNVGPNPAILMATDSQLTRETSKRSDSKKIRVVEFSNAHVLVAQAGQDALSNSAIDIFSKKAKSELITEIETPIKLIQESVREVRKHLSDVNQGCNFSDDAWRRYFKENNFELIVGYFFNRRPCLYTIDIDWCFPTSVRGSYVAIGIGRDLGEFLLGEYWHLDPGFENAWPIAVSVVEKVIDNVNGCDRPTCVGIVYPLPEEHVRQKQLLNKPSPESQAMIVHEDEIKPLIEELRVEEEKMKRSQAGQMKRVLKRAGKRRLKAYLKQLEENFV